MASVSSSVTTGITNVSAMTNFAKNVEIVDSHISLTVCLFSDSSDMCIPSASEKASAMAIVKIPPKTANCEWVPECSPTISPSVVMIPDVNPKLKPILMECFMLYVFY